MTIDKLAEMRKRWVEANRENDFEDGIKNLLTDLYPDNAHFTYELLQNAEDAGASKVQFDLNTDRLEFEHNGDRLFDIEDITAITSIGVSTKRDEPTSIGKFGIGFKAVFAYTATPEIESGPFHFRIRDMVVPDTAGLAPGSLGEKRTRFVFPFDNSEKSSEKARAEIETKLRQLNENTLLFLSNIRRIEYRLSDSTTGSLERRESKNDESQIEIAVTRPGNIVPDSTHYLRFQREVDVRDEDTGELKRGRIALAFGLDKSEDGGWKIIPLNPGQVFIYFPAVKETSNLRFHLHGPFASTVARDNVRDCPANDELRDRIADLVAETMPAIRDRGLLDIEFLATLPNNRDNLSLFYFPIQERLIEEFNEKKLIPMKKGGHSPALECYRGPRALSDLINDEDLATLLGKDRSQLLWIANPQQINQPEDNFLSMLGISQWTTEDLIKVLDNQSESAVELLRKKPVEWYQDLYGFLGDFLSRAPSSPPYIASERKNMLSNLCIVRCSDGNYRVGRECHFSDDDMELEERLNEQFHYVDRGVYASGQNRNQQEKAHSFLEKIGVCGVDEAERIKVILKQRYEEPDLTIPSELHYEDMKKFISLVESDPDKAALFEGYNIFNTSGGNWFTSLVFLDSPYLETGLNVYYEDDEYLEFIDEENVAPYFSLDYEKSDIDLKRLGRFAEMLGARTKLHPILKSTMNHPKGDDFRNHGTGIWRNTGIDEDYKIPEFQILIDNPSIIRSKLIWEMMCSLPEFYLKAQFCWNQSNELQEDYSSLVYDLRNAKWIPQKNGDSISFVYPRDASIERLPKGFSYETGQKWLGAIEFGKIAKQQRSEDIFKEIEQNRRNQRATEIGFNSADEASTMVEIANVWREQGKSAEESLKRLHAQERRKELLIIDLSDAEEKSYEVLARSIKVSGSAIDPRTALRVQYTMDENRMHCQMCSKGMPFKKRNSDEDYFESVEALGKGYFFKEHEAQYLALCPQCAAEYKEFVKRDPKTREAFHDALKNSDSPQIHVESNGRTIRIWFEDKHWQDLKTVLYYYENVYDPENSDD